MTTRQLRHYARIDRVQIVLDRIIEEITDSGDDGDQTVLRALHDANGDLDVARWALEGRI